MLSDNYHTSIFSALGEPRRLEIVELISQTGQMSASDISNRFQITSAAISQHLKVLREAEVLIMEKQAQKRLYQINPETFGEIQEWAEKMKHTWSTRFNQLDQLLSKNNKTSSES